MTFSEVIRTMGVNTDPYVELGMKKVMYLKVDDRKTTIHLAGERLQGLSEEAKGVMLVLAEMDFLMRIEAFVTAEVFGNGPKIFRPTAYQLKMLEQMQLTLTCKDFNMPFGTIVVELPKEFSQEKACNGVEPVIAILHHDKKNNLFIHDVFLNTKPFHSLKSWWGGSDDTELEEWCQSDYSRDTRPWDHLPTSQQEYFAEAQIRRAVLNYCLLLDEVGIKKSGPESPNEHAKLVKWCEKKTIHTTKNKFRLQAQPIVYDLERETQLVRVISESEHANEIGTHTGRKLIAHARRGYYRMQRYGIANSLSKRVRIPACIVNKHTLIAPIGATYKT